MQYALVIPGVSTSKPWPTRAEAEAAARTAKALGITDAWIAMYPDEDELDGTSEEGC